MVSLQLIKVIGVTHCPGVFIQFNETSKNEPMLELAERLANH